VIDVLVVDDDFMVARIHTGFVERIEGFRVVGTANTGAQALEAVAAEDPDLVLLDLYLPDVFGLDLITRLRAQGYDGDILAITAAREADTVRRAVRRGVVDYLLKPFGFEDLRDRLEKYAAQRSAVPETMASQEDVDRVFARSGRSTATLPKGLSPETADLVAASLRESTTTLSAAECAERVGISRVSARRYLEYFCTTGKAEVSLKYGATGRPERRYHWRG
jgi:response regulator of citrate/malate metabolism